MKIYSTTQGDTWDIASYRCYGDEGHVGALIAVNPAHADTAVFAAGVPLSVPEVAAVSTAINLPPWRKEA